jgi:hypothetical protein
MAVAEVDEDVANDDQRVAVASNHRHSTYITMIVQNFVQQAAQDRSEKAHFSGGLAFR